MPHSIPLVASIVPTAVLLLIHVPPVALLLNGVHWPSQALSVPPMLPGNAYTVTTAVVRQVVVDDVKVMVAVPAPMPVTVPPEEMMATEVGDALQVPPPAVLFVNVVVLPTQVVRVPPIADGRSLTVTTVLRTQPVPAV